MLESLHVLQYRSFVELTLPLRPPDGRGSGWTILVGENGLGKTSLLQGIVLGLLDARPATSLVPEPWTLCRQGMPAGYPTRFDVTVRDDDGPSLTGMTVFPREGSYLENSGSKGLSIPLLLGFSARRRLAEPGELPRSKNRELERVRGLFAADHALLTGDAFEALPDRQARRQFAGVVRDVVLRRLTATDERLFPLVDVVELRGAGGVTRNEQLLGQRRFVLRYGDTQIRVGVQDLSDGYQAMLGLVLELLNQAVLSTGEVPNPEELRAIVLVDELEAHLHPRWQRSVVPLLRDLFPRCQFIVTTHSPLVAGSAEPGEVVLLELDGSKGGVQAHTLDSRLSALGAEEVYETVFGVTRAASPAYVQVEQRYLRSIHDADVQISPADRELVEAAWASRAKLRRSP